MAKEGSEARRLFLEQYGGALVTNSYLRVALVLVSVVLVGVMLLSFMAVYWAKSQKPLVIRIDEVGRATALNYSAFDYKPQERELRYFLAQFVQLHYGRMESTVEQRFGASLYFLDSRLSQAIIDNERQNQSIRAFLMDGSDEIDVEIKNIALQDIRSTPMKANVDYELVYYARGERREVRREQYAGYFEFIVNKEVPNAFVLVNPLGLTITYFRSDAAFK